MTKAIQSLKLKMSEWEERIAQHVTQSMQTRERLELDEEDDIESSIPLTHGKLVLLDKEKERLEKYRAIVQESPSRYPRAHAAIRKRGSLSSAHLYNLMALDLQSKWVDLNGKPPLGIAGESKRLAMEQAIDKELSQEIQLMTAKLADYFATANYASKSVRCQPLHLEHKKQVAKFRREGGLENTRQAIKLMRQVGLDTNETQRICYSLMERY